MKKRHGILTYLRWIFLTLDRKAKADEKMADALMTISQIMLAQHEGRRVVETTIREARELNGSHHQQVPPR